MLLRDTESCEAIGERYTCDVPFFLILLSIPQCWRRKPRMPPGEREYEKRDEMLAVPRRWESWAAGYLNDEKSHI
jgi:hypothetical protein